MFKFLFTPHPGYLILHIPSGTFLQEDMMSRSYTLEQYSFHSIANFITVFGAKIVLLKFCLLQSEYSKNEFLIIKNS